MKMVFLIGATLLLIFGFTPVRAQDVDTASLYSRCITKTMQAPQDAYEPCKLYLEHSPVDDANRVGYVKRWVAQYEKALPYIQFLRGLTADQNAPWFVYEPDLGIELPQTSEKEGPNKIELSRSFSDAREEEMLRRAEAVYPGPGKMIESICKVLGFWAQEPPQEMAPMWGMRGNDNIQSANVVTARAVRYYYDLSLAARRNPHLPSGFNAVHTGLKYTAVIKHFDQYSRHKDAFQNVYVADLTLEWSFICGMLCGMGFTRNKLVVLNSNGDVIAMYLDAPANSQSWES